MPDLRLWLWGAMLLKGAVRPEVANAIRLRAEAAFEERDSLSQSGQLGVELSTPHIRRFVNLDELCVVDDLIPRHVWKIARGYLGHDPIVMPDRYVREIRPSRADTHLPYHQDDAILKRRSLNVWCALTPGGISSPGLELVLFSHRRIVETQPIEGSPYAVEKVRISEARVHKRFPQLLRWRPIVDPGDVLVFSGATIHRTYASASMDEKRLSVEIRLA